MTRAIRAIGSAALAAALTTALYSGTASAQTAEPNSGESEAKALEQTIDDLIGTATADSTEAAAGGATGTTPTATKPEAVNPEKKTSKPFKPTERIEAESVISFPANI